MNGPTFGLNVVEESIRLRAEAARLEARLDRVALGLIAERAAARRLVEEAAQCYLDATRATCLPQSDSGAAVQFLL